MGDREEEIWEGLEEEGIVVWCADMDSDEWRNRKVIGEVFKMGIRSGKENIELSREKGNTEGETEE